MKNLQPYSNKNSQFVNKYGTNQRLAGRIDIFHPAQLFFPQLLKIEHQRALHIVAAFGEFDITSASTPSKKTPQKPAEFFELSYNQSRHSQHNRCRCQHLRRQKGFFAFVANLYQQCNHSQSAKRPRNQLLLDKIGRITIRRHPCDDHAPYRHEVKHRLLPFFSFQKEQKHQPHHTNDGHYHTDDAILCIINQEFLLNKSISRCNAISMFFALHREFLLLLGVILRSGDGSKSLYRKDGKRIATRGREKAVMLELKQDLLCRIEAEPDYTGDLSDVVIKNTQYYLPEFEKARRNEKCRFNWAAFLFAGVFSYYRKSQDIFWQYYKWPFIIYAAIMLGISGSGFLAAKSEAGIAGWLIAVYVLSLAVSIYLLITCIRFGKSFNREYYQHCMVLAESSELSPRTTGVSAKNAVLFCLVAGLCAFGITAIATGLSGAAFLGGISDNASLDDIGFCGNASELSKADIVGRWNLVYYEDDDTVFSRESLVEGGASADDVEDYLSKNCVLFQVDDFCKFYSYDAGVITTSFLVWTLKDGQVEFIGQTKASAVPSARFEDGILCIQDGSILAKYKKVSDTPSAPDCEELSQGAADDDRSTWDYDDYVNYYGFDPADYGYMWYNEVRSGPLDEFFEWANEELTQTDNSSRLYSISDPFNADLSPDDFVGTWETQNGIIFTIQYLDGEYTIDLSENNLGILGGRFSDYLYNVEDAFCGMAGTSGTTSFSVYYEYGSDYPTSSWLVLDLTESNGNEVLDYVPLT